MAKLTKDEIKLLNNINISTQRVKLGEILNTLMTSGAGTGSFTLNPATTDKIGGVKKIKTVSDSRATDVEALTVDFNGLLKNLKEAGLM